MIYHQVIRSECSKLVYIISSIQITVQKEHEIRDFLESFECLLSVLSNQTMILLCNFRLLFIQICTKSAVPRQNDLSNIAPLSLFQLCNLHTKHEFE